MATPSPTTTNLDWKWSLKDLLIATIWVAAFLAIANYLGFSHPLLWCCVLFSGILAAFFAISIPHKHHATPNVVVAVTMLLLCNPLLMFFSLVMAVNSVSHLLFNVIASRFRTPLTVRRVLAVSFTLTLISFSIGVLVSLPGYYKAESAKERYRPIDLHERLSYESQKSPAMRTNVSNDARPSVDSVESLFAELSQHSFFYAGRTSNLKALHNGRLDAFVRSPGFGVGRFLEPSLNRLEFPEPRNIPFTVVDDNEYIELERASWRFVHSLPYVDSNETFHTRSVVSFANPAGTGLIIEPKVAAGFQPHAMHVPPQNIGQDYLAQQQLTLETLQLISLHRFESPRAYVLDHLPRMDQLIGKDVPTRVLSNFEQKATDSLMDSKTTEDIVSESRGDKLRMVGAVRAYSSCLACHSANRGDLLGAFTYTFLKTEKQTDVLNLN